jgi:hypothetical protein
MSLMKRSLLLACVAAIFTVMVGDAAAQVRAQVQVGGNRSGYTTYGRRPWFSNPGVRRQLKIDDDQYNTLNKSYTEYWTPYNQVVVGVPADLDEQQRQQRITAAYGTFNQGFNKASVQVFTDPGVRSRYNQLHLQYLGYGAFNDPTVQERLRLSDEQRQNFNRYNADWNKQMNTYSSEYAKDREGVNKQFGEHWKQTQTRINATLTPEQRKTWSEMSGESYDFPADTYFDHGEEREGAGRNNPPRNPVGPREQRDPR